MDHDRLWALKIHKLLGDTEFQKFSSYLDENGGNPITFSIACEDLLSEIILVGGGQNLFPEEDEINNGSKT